MSKKWLILLIGVALLMAVYLYPGPHASFEELYARVEPSTVASLQAFRRAHPPRSVEVDGAPWEYVSLGDGPETILFLHGMTGAYDIWWQQLEALQEDYRLIAVTYPAIDSLAELQAGVWAVLDAEGVETVNLVGSSLGGYLAQYLLAHHPERIERAVFANTFPPNDIIAQENKTLGAILPFLPSWLIMRVMSGSMTNKVYPAAQVGDGELELAFGLEQTHGRMSKAQLIGRYRCVIDPFTPPDVEALGLPVLIIEADNDPLVAPELRQMLKETYPTAQVETLSNVGHFPYLNVAEEYTQILRDFMNR